MAAEQVDVRCVLDARAGLGESPVWCSEEQALYWVDMLAPALFRLDPATGTQQSWWMPELISAVGLREGGGAVVSLRTGLHLLDLESGALSFLAPDPEDEQPATRLNDGKVAPEGRFWVGSMDEERQSRPLGSLYRLDPDHSCHQILTDLTISNGLAWSPDGSTMYLADTVQQWIRAYDYDPASGAISNQRVLASGPETGGPDGGTTDLEGYYWSAGGFAGVLNRWAPDGRLDRQIKLPIPKPSSLCFGGPELTTIYITSIRAGLSAEQLAQAPLSGGIFALDVDTPGTPAARYRG